MPPNLDIYVLTKRRERETIDRFLDLYVDRTNSEDRGDEDLMMVRLDHQENYSDIGAWEFGPSLSLSHIVDRGLEYPRRAFTIYLAPNADCHPIIRSMLTFTLDDKVIFGLSINDEEQRPENERRARLLLSQLTQQFDAPLGAILVETPPPLTEAEFREREGQPLTTCFLDRRDAASDVTTCE